MARLLHAVAVLAIGAVAAGGADNVKPGAVPTKAEESAKSEGAGRLPEGTYVEVDEKGVEEPRLAIRLRPVTANIVEVRGANGWVVFASYDEAQREYRGFFEWQQYGPLQSPGGKWADLYQVRLVRQNDGLLHMTGKSKANEFVIRAVAK